MKPNFRRDVEPPYAALELYEDQVRLGIRQPCARPPVSDLFESAAAWERWAIKAPRDKAAALARIGRAFLTGESPRTRHGRWRRDLAYLEAVMAEALATLPLASAAKYGTMVVAWRAREPLNIWRRYEAAKAERAAAGGCWAGRWRKGAR